MPHLINTTTDMKEAIKAPPGGPGFTAEQTEGAATLEVWGSDFDEPGDDYCEYKLLDKAGDVVAVRRVPGY